LPATQAFRPTEVDVTFIPQVHEKVIVDLHRIPDMDFVLDFGNPPFDTIICTVTRLEGRGGNVEQLKVMGPFPNFNSQETMYVYLNAVSPLTPVTPKKIKQVKSELSDWIKELS
jgi:hypothetical protein